jgi:hypothetical protein
MRDPVIVEAAVRSSHRQRQADRGARRRSPGRQHQPGRQTGARRGPDSPLPAATALRHPDNVVSRHGR